MIAPGSILVTGAAGFIGSHVCEALLARGERIVALDSFDDFYDPARKRANIAHVEASARRHNAECTVVQADFCDQPSLDAIFRTHSISGVIHLGARAGVRPSIARPDLYARTNVLGTTMLLELARRVPGIRFVCASSSSVYGNNTKTPFAEEDPVDHPISPYAATKKACELIGHTYHHLYGLPVAMLRFFTVFGPRQRPDLAISLFMRSIARGETIPVFGDGSTSRDYTYIADIVAGVIAAYDRIPGFGFRVWNLGGDHPITLRDMIESIERVVGRKAVIDRKPSQPGDVDRTWADLSRARAELAYAPRTSFDEGLRRQWEWMQTTPEHSA